MKKSFTLKNKSNQARQGVVHTRQGDVKTPFFMSVATRGAIKAGLDVRDLKETKAPVMLCNTYHLHLRPGSKIIKDQGGLHHFSNWKGPILTDSGGFQVFSIKRKKITDQGVFFNSHIDGKRIYIDADTSIKIQCELGADIIMAFDQCPASEIPPIPEDLNTSSQKKWLATQEKKLYFNIKKAVERTTDWAQKSLEAYAKYTSKISPKPQIFGIIQGGCFEDLRNQSLKEITNLPFDGFALGGLAVGESDKKMYEVLDQIVSQLPQDKPRYLMGVGNPQNIIEAVSRGIDMFDCVLPLREARHGKVYTWNGSFNLTHTRFKKDKAPIDPDCKCFTCKNKYSLSYLNHLHHVGEDLGKRLASIHNLFFYHDLMAQIQKAIQEKKFESWKTQTLKNFNIKKD